MFVDLAQIEVVAGDGGAGLVSFRREKFVQKGGPSGGDGGDGGHVIFVASDSQRSLAKFRRQRLIKAQAGRPGGRQRRQGRRGSDQLVTVPVGTVIVDLDTDQLLADLDQAGQQAIVANGGLGGFGNAHFRSSRRRTPVFAEKGQPGQKRRLKCELKLLADVGLVGLPNAGKSTFLSVVTRAKPAVADYPFTTIKPHLGVVNLVESVNLLLADIPGLIAGAHQGKGLGHQFLRHIERTEVILHLIDINQADVGLAYRQIRQELTAYSTKLAQLIEVVALTKADNQPSAKIDAARQNLAAVVPAQTRQLVISSHSGLNLPPILKLLDRQVKLARQSRRSVPPQESELIVFKADDTNAFSVRQLPSGDWLVSGSKIETFAAKTEFNNFQARQRLRDIMRRLGIKHELLRQGYQSEPIIFGQPEIGRLKLDQEQP